jgi:hypothetical protein
MHKIVIRWTVFFICLGGVYFFINSKVHAIAQANLQSGVIV